MTSRRPALVLLWLSGLLLLGAVPAIAQQDEPAAVEIAITDINIARYPDMTVIVDVGNVETFDAADLSVFQGLESLDATATPISQNPVPVGIVLAVDTSAATEGATLDAAKAAANAFVDNMRPQDLVAVVGFGESVDVFTGFTSNIAALKFAIAQLEAAGPGRLYDGVIQAADLYGSVGDNGTLERNLIVLVGSADDGSEATLEDAVAATEAEALSVYGVALSASEFDTSGVEALAGSSYVEAPDVGELATLYDDIQRSLDNRVVLSFTATEQAPRDVTFEVRYQNTVASQVVSVPGFIPNSGGPSVTAPPTYAVATPEPAESSAPSPGTLRLISVLTMGAAIALLVAIIGFGRNTDVVQRRLTSLSTRRFSRPGAENAADGEDGGFLKRIPLLSRFATQAEEVADSQGLLQPIANMLEQANILWRPGEVVAAAVAVAAVASIMVGVFQSSLLSGVLAFVILMLVIAVGLRFVASREKSKFVDQMPGTLGLIATSLRSGQSFLQALESVASEAPEPTSREYQRAVAEVRLGRPIGGAIRAIAERMDSEDFGWVVMATDIQREVGGNLAEVLDIVADTMLQRNRLRREVKALSAEGRISAIVLGALPVFIFLFLFTSNRSYLEPLIERTAGWIMIGVAITSMVTAFAWLRKIVNIEV
ncbi:MAG: type II secretion system F family protein [Acidimicrobiia bacterium]|nr:type II secretion system F family protein [Acidimicrobiia bacterium]